MPSLPTKCSRSKQLGNAVTTLSNNSHSFAGGKSAAEKQGVLDDVAGGSSAAGLTVLLIGDRHDAISAAADRLP
jgi:hypothetical protein